MTETHKLFWGTFNPCDLNNPRTIIAQWVPPGATVLEHLVDPWKVLRGMHPLLSPAGRVLISVPNIAHWTARLNLLLGRFDYTDGYLMDRTHLRWFTRRTAKEMALQTGYRVMAQGTVFKPHIARFWPTLMGFQTVLNLAPSSRGK